MRGFQQTENTCFPGYYILLQSILFIRLFIFLSVEDYLTLS